MSFHDELHWPDSAHRISGLDLMVRAQRSELADMARTCNEALATHAQRLDAIEGAVNSNSRRLKFVAGMLSESEVLAEDHHDAVIVPLQLARI